MECSGLDLQLVGSCNISQILSPVRLGLGLGQAQMGNKDVSYHKWRQCPLSLGVDCPRWGAL